jgi:NAD(P)-dependent dehydrogenase (short-subunit alcohol dehydrogenase family)
VSGVSPPASRPPLEGRLVVVTGAGAGIGLAVARRFEEVGDRVVTIDIDLVAAGRLAATVDDPDRIVPVGLDVADAGAVESTLESVTARHGPVDVLVNNAGIMDGFAPAAEVSVAMWDRVLAVNLSGPFHLTRAVLPGMVEKGAGAIVNIASVAGLAGGRAGAAYTASKHGLIGLTRNVAWQYADRGVRCNAVCPGPVATTITDHRQDSPEGRRRAEGLLGTRLRTGEPGEIANVVSFLCSAGASLVNGSVVTADAGWTVG